MVTVFCKSNKTHKISFFNWWHAHVIEVFARQIDELEMTSVSIYVSFLLESKESFDLKSNGIFPRRFESYS